METKEIFRITNSDSGEPQGAYQRDNYTQYDFSSPERARSSNCHDVYKDRVKYKISKYRVTIELIEDNVDPPNEKEIKEAKKEAEEESLIEKALDSLGLEGIERMNRDFVMKITGVYKPETN